MRFISSVSGADQDWRYYGRIFNSRPNRATTRCGYGKGRAISDPALANFMFI